MKLNYLAFLRKLFIYTFILAFIGYGIIYFLPEQYVSPTIPYLFVFFFSLTLLVHYVLLQVALKKAVSFINYFMLLTFGKLIFLLTIVLIYAFVRREDAVPFIIAFFILYMFYTAFEVVQSLSLTNAIKSEKQKDVENRNK